MSLVSKLTEHGYKEGIGLSIRLHPFFGFLWFTESHPIAYYSHTMRTLAEAPVAGCFSDLVLR